MSTSTASVQLPMFSPPVWRAWWAAVVARAGAIADRPYGLQGYILKAHDYAKLTREPFELLPPTAGQATTTAGAVILKSFNDEQRAIATLRAEVAASIPDTYLFAHPKFDATLGTALIGLKDILTFLNERHGKLTGVDVTDATAQIETLIYRPGEPIEDLVGRSLAAHAILHGASQGFSELQKIHHLARALEAADPVLKKIQFKYLLEHPDPSTIRFQEYADKLLATDAALAAMPGGRSTQATGAVFAAAGAPRPPPSRSEDRDLAAQLCELRRELNALKQAKATAAIPRYDQRRRPDRVRSDRARTDGYCWTHGACAHTSKECRNPDPGHQRNATAERPMGGAPTHTRRPR